MQATRDAASVEQQGPSAARDAAEAAGASGRKLAAQASDQAQPSQLATQQDEAYMRLALEEAQAAFAEGEVPIGAVVVHEPIDPATRRPLAEPRVIARAHNLREQRRNPAAHAEFLALEEAARQLDAWRLSDCTVYVTLEPCIMCAGLMHQARVRRCVYGAPDRKAGALVGAATGCSRAA